MPEKGVLMNSVTIRKSVETTPSCDFEIFWRLYPKRPNDNKKQAFRQWVARLKQGVEPSVMLDGAARYARHCEAEKTEPKFIKLAATFIGRDEHYLQEWAAQQNSKADVFDRWLTGNTGGEDGIIDV